MAGREAGSGGGAGRWAGPARGLRVGAGVVLVLGCSLIAPVKQAIRLASGSFGKDPIDFADRRFRRVRQALPPRGAYGYRAKGPLGIGRNHELDGGDLAITGYVIAQYVLAPRVLDLGGDRPIVIRDDLDPVQVTGGEGP